ncbi:MAG: DUF1501 domain-containing protein [Planctomycetia bacterium]|nr:DUF1501 domain-containing protein [Planctomycetia bacterium]
MLKLPGSHADRSCRRISRRDFLAVGSLGIGGLTLADLFRLRAQGAASPRAAHKAVIMLYLQGGPSHIDMYDLKPDAPAEYRGEFKPIQTNVPGFDICELMPQQAKCADRLALIRNMRFLTFGHEPIELFCGYHRAKSTDPLPNHPHFGSVVSKVREASSTGLPPFVDYIDKSVSNSGPAFLGARYQGFKPFFGSMNNLTLRGDVTPQRLADRKVLLQTLDGLKRNLDDHRGSLAGVDAFNAQALELLGSTRTRDAFDVGRESEKVRVRYPKLGQQVLLARRLVEAGVSVVTVGLAGYRWDTHDNNFGRLREILPEVDQSIHALVTDLHERGLEKDVLVVLWGEMGRSPKVSKPQPSSIPGRDHWPEAGFCLLAGGGLKMGQVIGATTPRGERSVGTPYTPQNVLATVYHTLGIDPAMMFSDQSGRPVPLLDDPQPVAELVG